jgi:hypothetical protein
MKYLLILPLFISCSLFKLSKLSNDVVYESKKICLNADGNGRLIIQGHKYVFGFETLWDEKELRWQMALNFPMHGEEFIELSLAGQDRNRLEFNQRLEEKILKEREGIDPTSLHFFMTSWAHFLSEIIYMQQNEQFSSPAKYNWKVRKNKLGAKRKTRNYSINANFYNVESMFFSRMDFALQPKKVENAIKIELIVRKCLNDES